MTELLSPVHELLANIGDGKETDLHVLITWTDGTRCTLKGLAETQELLDRSELARVQIIRIECTNSGNSASGVIVVAPRIPGFQLEVVSDSKVQALGVSELVFQRVMIGYVDRLGAWRAPILMLSAIAPIFLISIALRSSEASAYIRALVASIAGMSAIATFVWSYPRFMVSSGFELLEMAPERGALRAVAFLKVVYRHPNTRIALSILGALTLGVAGNVLSDLLPWPK